MLKKTLLIVKVLLPFILNVLLFFMIYNSQLGTEYALTNTLFYQTIANISFGIVIMYFSSRNTSVANQGIYQSVMRANLVVKDQQSKHNNRTTGSIESNRFRFIYIIIGVLFFIATIISNYI